MELKFENDFQKRLMYQSFALKSLIASKSDVDEWRRLWGENLRHWHSPYKAMIDCRNLKIESAPDIEQALTLMLRFFEGLFLKSVVGVGFDAEKGHLALPFKVVSTDEQAYELLGIRTGERQSQAADFRSIIQLQNHFSQHVMELSFSQYCSISSVNEISILKSKIMNNLVQWHSKWNLLIDCANIEIDDGVTSEFEKMLKFFNGFFLKSVLGYSPRANPKSYPFKVYRSRHNAAGRLEAEGKVSGDSVVCRSNNG